MPRNKALFYWCKEQVQVHRIFGCHSCDSVDVLLLNTTMYIYISQMHIRGYIWDFLCVGCLLLLSLYCITHHLICKHICCGAKLMSLYRCHNFYFSFPKPVKLHSQIANDFWPDSLVFNPNVPHFLLVISLWHRKPLSLQWFSIQLKHFIQ